MMLGMGDDTAMALPAVAVTAVAGTPAAVTWADLDQMVPLLVSQVTPAAVASATNENIALYCQLCADPKTALINKLGNSSLSPGMTIDGIVSRYSSQLSSVCGLFLAEAKRRGLPCAYAPAGFSLGGVSPVVIGAAALLAAAFILGGRD